MTDRSNKSQLSRRAAFVIVLISSLELIIGVGSLISGYPLGVIPLLIGVGSVIYLDREWPTEWGNDGDAQQTQPSQETPIDNALAVIRDRYARGEIELAEFERQLDHLLETETLEQAADYRDREQTVDRSW
jgi:uncharacterized membrane protein